MESFYSGCFHRRVVGGLDGGWSEAEGGQVKTQLWAGLGRSSTPVSGNRILFPALKVTAFSGKYSGSEFRKCQQAAHLKWCL